MSPCVNWRRAATPPRVVNCVRVLGRAAARELGARELYAPRCAYVLVRCAVASRERPVGVCALDEGPGKTLRAIAVAGLLTTRHLAAAADDHGDPSARFREPDLGDALTAVAVLPTATRVRRFLQHAPLA